MKKYFKLFDHTCSIDAEENCERRDGCLRKTIDNWITIDPTSNLTLQHFNSYATIVNERKRHLQDYPHTIHPFSRLKFLWEIVILLVFLVGMIYAPLMFLFYFDKNVVSSTGNLTIMLSVKLLCIIDMVIRFFNGYWDNVNFVTVLSKRSIALTYLKGLFIPDFLTNIPFFVGWAMAIKTDEVAFHFIKSLTLFRICRLTTCVRYCQRILLRFGVDDTYLEIFKLLFYWTLYIHWAACLHLIPGLIVSNFQHGVKVQAWYENDNFENKNAIGKYVICLFKSVKTIMGTGYVGDLIPKRYFDKLFSSILTMIGRVALCVTLAYIFIFIQGALSSSLRYDEMMVQLKRYTAQNKLPPSTQAKLRNNYDYIFRKRFFNEQEILKTVSAPLRQQILIHNTRTLVDNSPFFENLPSNLILKIVTALSVELYLEGDIIYTIGEIGTCVYFIISGSVAFYSPSDKEVCHYSDGDYFGEMILVSDVEQRYAKAVALETTKCYKLGKSDFQKLARSYPDLMQKVEALTIERIERMLLIEERENQREPFRYPSVNQQQFRNDRRST